MTCLPCLLFATSHNRALNRGGSGAGTGLSYSIDPADYVTDDYQTTQDLYEALLAWFGEYTFFANHTFIITGESYAGECLSYLLRPVNEVIVSARPMWLSTRNHQQYVDGSFGSSFSSEP